MNNSTPQSINLLNQKRSHLTSDYDIQMDSHLNQNDSFTANRLTNNKYSPFTFKEKKMSIDTYDESSYSNITRMGCNCKNSQCLKRYCECFSRMKFCDESICSCKNCYNTFDKEKERSEAIQNYMHKSPIAFKKINLYDNQIFCSCKKSSCLKKYCECYQSGMKCTQGCKCIECHNKTSEKKLFSVSGGNSTSSNNGGVSGNGSIINNGMILSSSNKRERYYSVETNSVCKQLLEWKTVLVEPENIIIDNYTMNINQPDNENDNENNDIEIIESIPETGS